MTAGHESLSDFAALDRALALAREGIGLCSPNPCVGAVILDRDGTVAGTGSHRYEDRDHAEVIALRRAGPRAKGGTLYINLEPCSHHGRTPPCVDAVIAAGVKRVVAAMPDPNPAVAGKGFARLRAAGIVVDLAGESSGMNDDDFIGLREAALQLNASFARYITAGMPLVTLKAAMTLDGKIAPAPGAGEAVSGERTRTCVQDMRHASDAIVTGIGTVLADDPLLTDRSGKPRRRPLLRAIVDSRLRIPLDSQLVKTAREDLVVFCAAPDARKKLELEARGVRVIASPDRANGSVDLEAMLRQLARQEIASVLLEGGAELNGAVLKAGLADRAVLFVTPKILGKTAAVPLASGAGFDRIADAPTLKDLTLRRLDDGFAVEGWFRAPY